MFDCKQRALNNPFVIIIIIIIKTSQSRKFEEGDLISPLEGY